MILEYEEYKQQLSELKPRLDDLKSALALDKLKAEIASLEAKTAKENFWDDAENSQAVLQKINQKKNIVDKYEKLYSLFEETEVLIQMGIEENDETLIDEISVCFKTFKESLDAQRLTTLLTGEYDSKNAILTFHAGAGGTEAQDWVEMLYRMYTRWAERHGFSSELLDYLGGDDAGIKSASILIKGENAYGYLRSETGVHRLVRISPFDSSGRRHTSFASLEVMPEIDDTVEVEIKPDDLRIDTYRSGGAGGQHINKTDSAVRITHLPTGIVVACQNERSQHQNKDMAMKMLKSKLIEIKEREHLDKIDDIKGDQKDIGWGSQIRSYVFMPYTLVKDHRTNYENGNITAVMDGDLDGFINAYLKAKSLGEI